jgi:hypothetical protein
MWPFAKKEAGESVALIDIGSSTVGAALVHLASGTAPVVCYTARVPVDRDLPLTQTDAMLRTFTEIGERLVLEGAPQLRQACGSGTVDRAVVSLSSPWHEAKVKTLTIQPGAPFTYTKSLAVETLKQIATPEGHTLTQTIVATLLNGYRTTEPFGKKANRADIIVLSSLLETTVLESVSATLKKLFHTREVAYIGFAELCYSVLRDFYPHEREFVVLSVSGEETDVASIKHGHIVDVGTLPLGTNVLKDAICDAGMRARSDQDDTPAKDSSGQPNIDKGRNDRFAAGVTKAEEEWVGALADLLRTLGMRHALPRAIFLIADEDVRLHLTKALETPSLRALWLSDEPISVIAVEPSHFSSKVTVQGLAHGDTELALLALYAARAPEA